MRATWSFPTTVRFGAGRVAELAEACRAAGIARPLLVTDRGLAGQAITAAALDALTAGGLGRALWGGVDPNPTEANLADGIGAFRGGGHDGIVAFGGGSALDLGKLVALMAGQPAGLAVWDLEEGGGRWRAAEAGAVVPVVAVPTTAGTGSEVGRSALLTRAADRRKVIVTHPRMLPACAILDPALTVGLPPSLTAGTGMDALSHAIEAYCSPAFHPMSQGIALEAIRMVLEALPAAWANPADLEARGTMLAAASMGAVAFQKGLGAVHALSHAIGARHDTHHGTTNAVLLPAVLDLNRPAVADRLDRAAAYCGIAGGADGLRLAVIAMRAGMALPAGLSALGVPVADAEAIVALALRDPTCAGNPLPVTAAMLRRVLDAAF